MNKVKKLIRNLRIDYKGYLFKILRINRMKFISFRFRIFNRILCNLRGVKLGKKVEFFGLSKFKRCFNSTIEIGDNCKLLSSFTSNLIGVTHPCLIATTRENAIIKIGQNSGISGAIISAAEKITIGKNTLIGVNCVITDTDWHNVDPKLRTEKCDNHKPVSIGNNVWLGMNVLVLKGVSIGDNSVIGANSVVIKDIPANVIAAGNPCKVTKNIN